MQQTWDPEQYARLGRFVADLANPVVELLAPQPGEHILDLGCGDGALTEKFMALGCVVVGVDGSPEQVAAAQARGLDARLGDGQRLAFDGEFDAVFSNAALHWMKRPTDVVAGVFRALRPGGRFVAECGGAGCIQSMVDALRYVLARRSIDADAVNPWYFASDEEYRRHLEAGGFVVQSIALVARPTVLPGDAAAWLETFGRPFLLAVPEFDRPAFLSEVNEAVRPQWVDAGGRWVADYVRLRFAARKPERPRAEAAPRYGP